MSVLDHSLLVLNIFKKDQLRAVYSVSLKILSFVYLFTVSQPSAFLLYKKELKDKAQTLFRTNELIFAIQQTFIFLTAVIRVAV